jgi:hypothetical protein
VLRKPLIPAVFAIVHHHQPITGGHRPLQLLAITLDLRLLASSPCQPSCAIRHSTWSEGVLHYVYGDAASTSELVYRLSVLRLIWPAHCHFSVLIRCIMLVTFVLCRITSFWIRSNLEHSSLHSPLSDHEIVDHSCSECPHLGSVCHDR